MEGRYGKNGKRTWPQHLWVQFRLCIWRFQHRQSVKIHEITKEFWKLFQMRPTTFVRSEVLRICKQSKLNGSIAQKRWYLLYFGRSLHRCFWTKWVEIHEILKGFWKIYQVRPTIFFFSKALKNYKQSKLNGSYLKNSNNHYNLILVNFSPFFKMKQIFLQKTTS